MAKDIKTDSNHQPTEQNAVLRDVMIKLGGQAKNNGETVVITKASLRACLRDMGILPDDYRIRPCLEQLAQFSENQKLSYDDFLKAALQNAAFLKKLANRELAIVNFSLFASRLNYVLDTVRPIETGKCADYIPTLKQADPNKLGLAFCSIDGQFYETGDSRTPFSIQSCSKSIMLALALENVGVEDFNKWVGVSPSGRAFNHASLLPDGRPFNPMINAGAIMTSAVVASAFPEACIQANENPEGPEKVRARNLLEDILVPMWSAMSGQGIVGDIGFDEETFLCERATGDNNYSLAYLMRGKTGLPEPVKLETMMDLYFRSCSIEATAATLSVVAATLANGGKCPLTGRQVIAPDTVRLVLSCMVLSGMYDAAGDFYLKIGAPAKSGVSGCVMVVIPSLGGYCVFSPRLDSFGHSARGVAFCENLHSVFRFHAFDTVGSWTSKEDPQYSSDQKHQKEIEDIRWALSIGDQEAMGFAELLKLTAVYVGWADSKFTPGDYKALIDAYNKVTQSTVSATEMEELVEEIGSTMANDDPLHGVNIQCLHRLLDLLKEKAPTLGDMQKELILETALLVSYPAEGEEMKPVEHMIVNDICSALGVPTDVLPLKMSHLSKNKGRRISFLSGMGDKDGFLG